MPRVETTAVLDDPQEALRPRTALVREEEVAPGEFVATSGPVEDYKRTVVIDGNTVRQTVEYRLAVPWFGFLVGPPYKAALQSADPKDDRRRWWAPPEPVDTRAAATLATLAALSAVAVYPAYLLSNVIEFAREELHFSKGAQGLALAAVRMDFIIALFIVGLADRRGRRSVTITALTIGLAVTTLATFSPRLEVLTGLQMIARGCVNAAVVLMGVHVVEEMPANARAYAVSVLSAAGAIGAGLALALFPVADLDVRGWRLLFAAAVVGIPLVRAFGRTLPESRRFARTHVEAPVRGHGRRLWLLVLSGLALNLFVGPASQYQNVFLRRERGYSASKISIFTVATNIWGGLGLVVGGRLADIRGRRVVASVAIAGGVGATVVMFLVSGWPIWAWSVIGAIVGAATVPALSVYGPELFPTSLRGRANGLISAGARAGTVLGLLAMAGLATRIDTIGPALALLALGPAALVVLVLVAYPETAHKELEELNPEDAPQ